MKCSVTFKLDAPGGYGGTHFFFSMGEQRAFLARAVARIPNIFDWLAL